MFLTFLRESIRFSTVFLYGSTGETITQKSGHLNLGTPGVMCIGAIGGSLGELWYIRSLADLSQMNGFLAVFIPILTALLFGGLAGLLFSFFTVTLRCNQNVIGLTITTFGVGLNKFILGNMDNTGFSEAWTYFIKTFPCANDNWFTQVFFSYGTLVYLALIIAIITTIVLKKTRVGLTLRAVGENPATADAAGINVTKYRYVSTIIGCAISGLGGLFYIMDCNCGSIGNIVLRNPQTDAITIPMTATVELQDKIIAYRLKNGQAEAAYLTVDRLNDGNRFIVKEGLSVGDTLIAEGVGLVREGMSITPKNETK